MQSSPRRLDADALRSLFDKVYVINLVERLDRRREIAAQLALVGLSFDDPLVELVAATRPSEPGAFPSIGARGCFLSHLDVLNRAVSAGCTRILIIEDDMDWTRAALSFAPPDMTALAETDWAFLHGGIGADGKTAHSGPLRLHPLAPGEDILQTHFIGLRGAAIPEAVRYLSAMLARPAGSPEGGPMHVDGAYSWLRKDNPQIRGYVCTPSVARQRPSKSDINAPEDGWRANPQVQYALDIGRRLRKRLGI